MAARVLAVAPSDPADLGGHAASWGARARGSATPRACGPRGPPVCVADSPWARGVGQGLSGSGRRGGEPADADQQRTEPIPVVPAMTTPVDTGLAAPPDAGQHPGLGRRIPGAAAARSWWVPLPAWRCSPWRSLASSSPAGGRRRGPAGLVMAYPPGRSPMGSSPGRAAHPHSRCCPRSPGWPGRPHGGGCGLAGRASLRAPAGPDVARWRPHVAACRLRAPAGGMPLMVAGGHGRWLAVGPDAAWTSPDGRSWRLGPGVAPLASGDRVRALAQTRAGFVAVGENVRPLGDDLVRTPVLWMSANGLTWQRRGAGQLDLPAGKGRVPPALGGRARRRPDDRRRGRPHGGEHHGKRKVTILTQSPGVWWSKDNGAAGGGPTRPSAMGRPSGSPGWRQPAPGSLPSARPHLQGDPGCGGLYLGPQARLAFRWSADGAPEGRAGVISVAGSDQGVVAAGWRPRPGGVRQRARAVLAADGSAGQVLGHGRDPGDAARRIVGRLARPPPAFPAAGREAPAVRRPGGTGRGGGRGPQRQRPRRGPRRRGCGWPGRGAPAAWSRAPGGQWAPPAVGARPSGGARVPG